MKPSESIKPISYLKAHASEIINDISLNQESPVILKMLAMSSASVTHGRHKSIKQASRDIKHRLRNAV